jgi:hypothetical protein
VCVLPIESPVSHSVTLRAVQNPGPPFTPLRGALSLAFVAVALFLALAASAHAPGGKTLEIGHRTAENAVGPIYYSEPLAQVWKTLGKAAPSRGCGLGGRCSTFKYTDGQNLLILDFDTSYAGIGMIRVFAHAHSIDATKLPTSIAPLSTWRWRGAHILRLPPPQRISGWTAARDAAYTSFSYGHGCLTAFETTPGRPRFMFFCE